MTHALTTLNPEREKLELIKQTVAKGATDLELQLFMHACQRTGLDPLMKQIYAIKRWSNADRKEVMSFQTGIDGYRLIADRTGCYAGSDEPKFEEDSDGLQKATVTVYKLVRNIRCGFTASAIWVEYCQTTKEGQPTTMWKKMPYLMLSKCAEALALRKAFPAELSGVYTHEEMMQADTTPAATSRKPELPVPDNVSPDPQVEAPTTVTPDLPSEVSIFDHELRHCARTNQAINDVWRQVPEHLKQDLYAVYSAQLKGLKKA